MSDEEQLQKEWRSIVINKLDSLDNEIKSVQGDIKSALAYGREVQDLKSKTADLEKRIEASEKSIMAYIKNDVLEPVKKQYITQEEFSPIKKLTYGAIALVLLTVGAELMSLIFKNNY